MIWWHLRRLESGSYETKVKAAQWLVLRRAARAVEPLARMCQRNDYRERILAVQSLIDLGQPAALKYVIENGFGSPSKILAAVSAHLHDPGWQEELTALAPRLCDLVGRAESGEARTALLILVGRLGNVATIPRLLLLLADPDPQLAQVAQSALDTIDSGWRMRAETREAVLAFATQLAESSGVTMERAILAHEESQRELIAGAIRKAQGEQAAIDRLFGSFVAPVREGEDPHYYFLKRRGLLRALQRLGWQPPEDGIRARVAVVTGNWELLSTLSSGAIREVINLIVEAGSERWSPLLDSVPPEWADSEPVREHLPFFADLNRLFESEFARRVLTQSPQQALQLVMENTSSPGRLDAYGWVRKEECGPRVVAILDELDPGWRSSPKAWAYAVKLARASLFAKSPYRRSLAGQVLAQLIPQQGASSDAAIVAEVILQEADAGVTEQLGPIIEYRRDELVVSLIDALESADFATDRVARALGKLRDVRALEPLVAGVESASWKSKDLHAYVRALCDVRDLVAEPNLWMRHPEAVSKLKLILSGSESTFRPELEILRVLLARCPESLTDSALLSLSLTRDYVVSRQHYWEGRTNDERTDNLLVKEERAQCADVAQAAAREIARRKSLSRME